MSDKKYVEIREKVIDVLRDKLPSYLSYHSIKHTLYVEERCIYIASKENISKKELFLLKVAALYHDYGFIVSHIEHEQRSCDYARKELKEYNINKHDIEIICGMIIATKIPQLPRTQLERILADADLEYLGTKYFVPVSEKLYEELKHYNPKFTRKQWNELQINFISNHKYHTRYCRQYKEKYKRKNLQVLLSNL